MKQILNWFRLGRLNRGLDRELEYHIDRRTADLIARGLPEKEASRLASMELGGVTQVQEEVRDVWLTRWLRDFLYDLRFSARSFRRSPSFTITAVLSLALGIGATTAIYSLVDQVLLHALPVRQPEQLVLIDWIGDQASTGFGSYNLVTYPFCRDLQQQERVFDGVFCRALTNLNLATGGDPKPAIAEVVSGSYFPVLGVRPALGRLLDDQDDGPTGSNPVVVLSYDFWATQFAKAPDIVGRKILVNRHPMTVIGVADQSFHGIDVGETPVLWLPASMSADAIPGFTNYLDRRTRWMQALGRLRQDVALTQAQTGLQPWFKAMVDEDTRRPGFPNISAEDRRQFLASTIKLTPAPQGHSILRRGMTRPLWMLFAITGVLLGLSCLNVAGLFVARGSAREREMTTRLALGASRGRIGRQLLADSIALALAGGLLGVALAPLAVRTLIAMLPADQTSTALHSSLDARLLLFAFLASVAAGILSGLAPALEAGRGSLISSLRERGGTAFGGVRLRKAIVTAQIAFSLILVIGAALFVRTLNGLMAKGPGFVTTSLISFGLDPERNGYTRAQSSQLIRRIYDEVRSSPNVRGLAMTRNQLLSGGSWNGHLTIQANERITTGLVHLNSISPGFFQTMGIRLIAGREFNERDSRPVGERGGARVAIVNESFVKRYLGGRDPLGLRICIGTGPDAKPNIEVVGVVAYFSYRGIREENDQAYFPLFEGDITGASYYVKIQGAAENAFAPIRKIVQRADPGLPISYFRTVDEQVDLSLNTERMLATLSTAFGALALLLSLVGLYGVMSFVVTQRTREIGIRLALGATESSAIWLVLRDALIMIVAGAAIALPSAAALGRLLESQLFGVKPTDPLTIATATLILGIAAVGAALIPARRASHLNPVDALRFD
jgi:predicted permease